MKLGDRMKMYEAQESGRRFMPGLPVYARIDGRTFSKFTRGMGRPYDERMQDAMIWTTTRLVEETNAVIGYTQSDEISLVWYDNVFFDGRIQKMTSQLGALASVYFLQKAIEYWPDRCSSRPPTFDARVHQVPSKEEAVNCLLWRELDATKNSITMAAQTVYGHKQLQNKVSSEKHDMLMEKGINWNDYPSSFKRGTYITRQKKLLELDDERLKNIPVEYRPRGPIERTVVEQVDLPPLMSIQNKVGVIFHGEEPIIRSD